MSVLVRVVLAFDVDLSEHISADLPFHTMYLYHRGYAVYIENVGGHRDPHLREVESTVPNWNKLPHR